MWEPALGGRGPAGWPRPISGVSDLTVAARGQPPRDGSIYPTDTTCRGSFLPQELVVDHGPARPTEVTTQRRAF